MRQAEAHSELFLLHGNSFPEDLFHGVAGAVADSQNDGVRGEKNGIACIIPGLLYINALQPADMV